MAKDTFFPQCNCFHPLQNLHTYVYMITESVSLVFITCCVTLCGQTKEAARTLRKQDPALPENCALNRCEECFKLGVNSTLLVYGQSMQDI